MDSMCARDYAAAFLVLGLKKTRKRRFCVKKCILRVRPHPLKVGVPTALQDANRTPTKNGDVQKVMTTDIQVK